MYSLTILMAILASVFMIVVHGILFITGIKNKSWPFLIICPSFMLISIFFLKIIFTNA